MIGNAMGHVVSFWKPCLAPAELQLVARDGNPDDPPSPGITIWRSTAEAHPYRVAHDGSRFSLFAAVHPIGDVPPSAEVIADICDWSGEHYSYVLKFPEQNAVLVPFDPSAAVEAVRREEYIPGNNRTILPRRLLSLYYAVKPLVPGSVKAGLRRYVAGRADAAEHFLDWPTDQSLDHLLRLMLRVMLEALGRDELQFAWFWPGGHPWAAVLTHDVETAAGLAHLPHIMEIERQKGVRSSFNFVPRDYVTPDSVLQNLRESGFEVGVHGLTHDGALFSDWPAFVEGVGSVNDFGRRWDAAGFRSPCTYRNPDLMARLEFEYDSSYSNSARYEPQPGGCASFFPFPLGPLVELPITLPQDHTLFGVLGEMDGNAWFSSLERIRDAHGMACILTHPDPARGYVGLPENEAHYTTLLDAVVLSEAWSPLPRELARWWRARAQASLEEMEGIAGLSLGTALIDASGHLQLVPPAR